MMKPTFNYFITDFKFLKISSNLLKTNEFNKFPEILRIFQDGIFSPVYHRVGIKFLGINSYPIVYFHFLFYWNKNLLTLLFIHDMKCSVTCHISFSFSLLVYYVKHFQTLPLIRESLQWSTFRITISSIS